MRTTNGELSIGTIWRKNKTGSGGEYRYLMHGTETIGTIYDTQTALSAGPLMIAAANTIHRIAARLGVDPLKLAESGAVERIVAEADEFQAYYSGNKIAHLGNGKAMKTCVAIREALAACRQTEDWK